MSVSVIIAAYNARDTIARSVASVLNQTRPPVEVIVGDDVSTDDTKAVVRKMAKADPRIKLIEGTVNKGPSGPRNAGFRAAKGEWVAIHDADDAWRPDRLEKMMDAASRYDADLVADNHLLHDIGVDKIVRAGFSPDRGVRSIKPIDAFEQDIKLGAEFGYGLLQPIIRKEFLEQHGLAYNEGIRYGEDLIFLAELLFSGARAVLIPDPLYIYTTRVGELSGAVSPHSKSVPRFDLIADGIDGLKAKYPQAISVEIDRAMTQLAARYRTVHETNLAREVRLRRGLLAYALYVGQRPDVAAQVVRQQWRQLWQRLAVERSGAFAGGSASHPS